MRGDVSGHALSPPLSTRGRNANRQFLRNAWYPCVQLRYLVSHTWYTSAQLRYLVSHTSLGIGWEAIMQTVCTKYPFLSELIFASCVSYSDRAYYGRCVLIEDIGWRLPLQLHCSYQGQQGDVSQSVRGNLKPVSERDKI